MTKSTTIVSVKKQPSGLWVIQTSPEGTQYATKDPWLASVADRARIQATPMIVQSSSGWYYRDLRNLFPASEA